MSSPPLRAQKSLRLRLVLGLSLTLCVLWGSVAAWMFPTMQRELRLMLDNRLIASAKMVSGLVQQFQLTQEAPLSPDNHALQSVIGRDGVACEVSLVRSEVEIVPLARTSNSPDFTPLAAPGFGSITKGGKQWRTYVLEENGIRVATADRLDVREQLVTSFIYTLVLPFVLALMGVVLLSWWITTWCLQPLRQLGHELEQRPPHDPTPVQAGMDTAELAPLVGNLNDLLTRMDAAFEHERRWTADAAHELRTPLTAIKTHVQVAQLVLARSHRPAEPATQALRQAHEGIDHMHATLEQLLQLARLENAATGAESPSTCGTAIAQALELACRQSQQRATQAAAHTQRAAPTLHMQQSASLTAPNTWLLKLAPSLLTCAVTNLLDNALRHHQGATPVQVRAALHARPSPDSAQAQHELVIAIQDQGPGMAPQESEQARQRFWRKTSASQGSGLGLTIVQRIAESAGGQLHLDAPTDGSTGLVAQLRLPVQQA